MAQDLDPGLGDHLLEEGEPEGQDVAVDRALDEVRHERAVYRAVGHEAVDDPADGLVAAAEGLVAAAVGLPPRLVLEGLAGYARGSRAAGLDGLLGKRIGVDGAGLGSAGLGAAGLGAAGLGSAGLGAAGLGAALRGLVGGLDGVTGVGLACGVAAAGADAGGAFAGAFAGAAAEGP